MKPITAEACTPQWIDQVHDNIVRLQECIKSWESAAEAHNND